MLSDTKRIEPTSPSAELCSSDEESRRDNTTKYGERTSHCLVRNARLSQIRSPWKKAIQDGTIKLDIHT
jgi:hypothetical protein